MAPTPEHPPEQEADPIPDSLGTPRDPLIPDQTPLELYQTVLAVYEARMDQLKAEGVLRRPSQIKSEEEFDDHCDDLSRLYRQTWGEIGGGWPPPDLSDEEQARLNQS